MSSRLLSAAAALAVVWSVGCAAKQAEPEPLFAPRIAQDWTLENTAQKPAADAPETVRRFSIRKYETAAYTGKNGSKVNVQVFEMAAEASGLHLEQTWVPAADTVAFHRGRYFAIVEWQGPRDNLNQFVRELGLRLSR